MGATKRSVSAHGRIGRVNCFTVAVLHIDLLLGTSCSLRPCMHLSTDLQRSPDHAASAARGALSDSMFRLPAADHLSHLMCRRVRQSDLFVGHLVQHHLCAHVYIQQCCHVHTHAKSVQELWPQLSLLRSGQAHDAGMRPIKNYWTLELHFRSKSNDVPHLVYLMLNQTQITPLSSQ